MTTDKDFGDIANGAYNADPLWTNPPWEKGQGIPPSNPRFQIVEEPVSDPVTGFQAITVAPLLPDGRPDLSQIYVSFAGTNPAHHADLNSDAQTVIAGKLSATQVEQALKYAEAIRAQYPGADFTAVGHSLGGFLAMLVAAEKRWSCTSFNGPDPWDQLSPEARKWLKELIAANPDAFRNFVNEWDAIGNSHGNGTGAAIYVTGKPFQGLFDNHNLSSGFDFDETGRIEGAGVAARNGYEIMENLLHGVPQRLREPLAALGAGAMAALQIPVIGEGVGRSVSTVMVMIDTMAATSLASTIVSAADILTSIKSVNEGLAARLQLNLLEAKSNAYTIPYLTEADIENCVAVERLRVEDNLDHQAVDAVNRRLDDHVDTIHKLYDGITKALLHAGEQDARWANAFGGR
ncbi:alpha/beta hydrolase [Leifsonia sp. C5G2]|uniref:alpha/beta hydrolase n=1 Tax=Leifsonia sp. C5G2 TaxID=2735269 RepID=UPI001C30F8DA|nr:alpha/beta hydrolase [Leifsonia sp. C5G2]